MDFCKHRDAPTRAARVLQSLPVSPTNLQPSARAPLPGAFRGIGNAPEALSPPPPIPAGNLREWSCNLNLRVL